MIRYALACRDGHDFESWFPSAASFDDQTARGLVTCPACGSTAVDKRIMAPAIGAKRKTVSGPAGTRPPEAGQQEAGTGAAGSPPSGPGAAPQSGPVALVSEREGALRSMLRAMRDHVMQNAEHVGRGFAAEARRMHYGESEHRSIYGQADADEARALLDEGIDVQALPVLPEDRN